MQKTLEPSVVDGEIIAPASKSLMLRAIAAAAMCDGLSVLKNYSACNDSQAAINIIKSLGCEVSVYEDELHIRGEISAKTIDLECDESALCAHIFACLASVLFDEFKISAKGSLLRRNMSSMAAVMQNMGLEGNNSDFLPFTFKGQINEHRIKIDGSSGSQMLSGLLMALPLCDNDSVVEIENLKSKPYIDLTIELLSAFGISVENYEYSMFYIRGKQKYTACNYNLEGDWSGASCLLVAGAVGGKIAISNLNINSLQADAAIIDVLLSCGAKVYTQDDTIFIEKDDLQAFNFDANDSPDLFPALVALAVNCKGTSTIKGVLRLQNKESSRALCLQSEFAKLGAEIIICDDEMQIKGNTLLSGGEVSANNDHRMAMSLAVASVNATEAVIIGDAESVDKSYPKFWDDFASVCTKKRA